MEDGLFQIAQLVGSGMAAAAASFVGWHQYTDRRGDSRLEDSVSQVADQVKDLHRWHDKYDHEGRPIWYGNRAELVKSLDRLGDAVDELKGVVAELRSELRYRPIEQSTDHGDRRG